MRNLVVLFFVACLPVACIAQRMDVATWLRTITGNAVTAKGSTMKPGFALYYNTVGSMQVPYLVYVPQKCTAAKAAPVVVFLHGAILAKEDFQHRDPEIADEPIFWAADSLGYIAVFPFAKSGFAWPASEAACENILTIAAQVKERYNVDAQRVYLGGISMGGHGTHWVINNKPDAFARYYTFSAFPDDIKFANVTKEHPLYSLYSEDDASVPYNEVKRIWEQHRQDAPGWSVNSVNVGGHRFIYKAGGYRIMLYQMGKVLKQ